MVRLWRSIPMRAPASAFPRTPTPEQLHADFLRLLPRVELHVRVSFRDVRCLDQREDFVAEAIALSWSWFRRLVERGKDPTQFPSALAAYAARAVRGGRRLAGQDKANDVMSPGARQRHGFTVRPLGNVFDEALRDNTVSLVPDQVIFRCDFPVWRRSGCERDRRLIDDLAVGERTCDAARKYGLSSGRVSQLRREFREDWDRFCADPADAPTEAP